LPPGKRWGTTAVTGGRFKGHGGGSAVIIAMGGEPLNGDMLVLRNPQGGSVLRGEPAAVAVPDTGRPGRARSGAIILGFGAGSVAGSEYRRFRLRARGRPRPRVAKEEPSDR
jgi:hypothetical protein